MLELLKETGLGFLDLIYPPICLICRRDGPEVYCSECRRDIQPICPPFCSGCGMPIHESEKLCRHCLQTHPSPIAWSTTVGHYHGTFRTAIRLLKYERKTALVSPLGLLLSALLDDKTSALWQDPAPDIPEGFDCIVPIPLHPYSLSRRGFNQAALLAQIVSRTHHLPIIATQLRRKRFLRSQTELDPAGRAQNVRGVFGVSEPLGFLGKRVLLVDDVITTSATVREAALTLRQAGAIRVCVIALARGG